MKKYVVSDLNILDAVWAGYFGIFYRKFFWDFVGGTLRDPGGMQYVSQYLIVDKLLVKPNVLLLERLRVPRYS